MSDPVSRLNAALDERYRIERELGEGGMATVYLADDLKHERKVALKVLKPELAAIVGAQRFLAEIKTTANLQHPHILPLFDSGEADGFLFYVMPFVDGESLRDRLDREKQLGVDEALAITADVADALDYAHRQGVLHRDIKPANILLHDGRPVMADFGIALALSAAGGGRMTETGLSLGTPHYMSPEQATADRDLTARSDVYSLASVLYEMLAGDPPHTGSTAQAVLVRILTEKPRPVSAARSSVPRHVAAALSKALEKLPADRFESAAAFKDALARSDFTYSPASSDAGVVSEPVGPAGASPVLARWAPWAVAAVAVLFAVLRGLGTNDPAPVSQPAMRSMIDLGELDVAELGFDEIVISPDGSRLATIAASAGVQAIFWRSAAETEFRMIPGTEGDPDGIAFSPDGDWIAYIDYEREAVMKVSVLGGAPQPVVPEGAVLPIATVDWGAEGQLVFHGRDQETDERALYRVSDTGGSVERLLGLPWYPWTPRLLPDGSGVVFSDRQTGSIALYDLATDSVTTLIEQGTDATYAASGHLLFAGGLGVLWAQPFDLDTRTVRGDAKPVVQGLAASPWFAPYSVSRGGALLYTTGGPPARFGASLRELAIVGLDGTVARVDLEPRRMAGPRWSPDGQSVVYAGTHPESPEEEGYQIWLYDAVRATAPRPLTTEGDNVTPIWSPDGTQVVFSSIRDRSDGYDVFVKSVLDDAPSRRLLSLPYDQYPTDWPEEHLITVESRDPPQILLLDLTDFETTDSVVVQPYFTTEATVDQLRVSPSADWAAYTSDKTGRTEIYLRTFPEYGAEIPISEAGGAWPQWSPDGETLFYQDLNRQSIRAVRIEMDPSPTVVSRELVVAATGQWDLHPDGDRFIMTRGEGAPTGVPTPVRHILVTNWFDELRQIFEGGGS